MPICRGGKPGVQQALASRGRYADGVDGIFGPYMRGCHHRRTARFGLPAGSVDNALLLDLGLAAPPALPAGTGFVLPVLFSQPKGLFAMTFLSGYRTYIIAGLMLITGIAGILGVDIPSFAGQAPGHLVMKALAFFFLRQGLKVVTTGAN